MEIRNEILTKVNQEDVINGTLTIPDNVRSILSFVFKDIDVKKIILGKRVSSLEKSAFSGSNVEEVVLNNILIEIPDNCFFNCTNLNKINLSDRIYMIGRYAFYGCSSLESVYIGHDLIDIGNDAFVKTGIKKFDTLYNEYVADTPCHYFSPDGLVLIDKYFNVVAFANGCDLEEYNLANYSEQIIDGTPAVLPIYSIKNNVFKGSKLKKLIIPSSLKDVGYNSFDESNIDTLEIHGIDLFSSAYFQIGDNGNYLFNDLHDVVLPIKTLIFSGDLTEIKIMNSNELRNVENIIFDKSLKRLNVSNFSFFYGYSNVKHLNIPYGVTSFNPSTFNHKLLYTFEDGSEIYGNIVVATNKCGEYTYRTITKLDNEDTVYKVYKYKGNVSKENLICFRVIGNKEITYDHPDFITSYESPVFNNVYKYADTLDLFKEYDIHLSSLENGVFVSLVSHEDKKIFLDYLKKNNCEFITNLLNNIETFDSINSDSEKTLRNINRFIDYIELLKKYNVSNPVLYNSTLIANMDLEELEYLLSNHYELFIKVSSVVVNNNPPFDPIYDDEFNNIKSLIFKDKKISTFIDKLNKYNIKDRFLYDVNLIMISDNPLFDQVLKYYDGNMKRLLLFSNTMNINNRYNSYENANDLLTMMKVCGCFNPDPVRRQKNQTYIIERVFQSNNTLDVSELRIVGNDIHSVFNFNPLDEDILEFEDFFRENYLSLLSLEAAKSGYIKRIYENFKKISNSSSSNRGEQRHLKVTLDKCISYLKTNKFNNIPREYIKLAELIGEYFDEQEYLDYAIKYYKESMEAPRNIFISPTYDEEGNKVYDYNPDNDLKKQVNEEFSYEWLPKQGYENLILGKFCNCCAHIAGAGTGIMRASMITDTHQNLVIRNNMGEIVAKATIYVNKEKGYAVFNTVEASFKIRSNEYSYPLYEAFIEGCKDFINVYNNNFNIPITKVSIGVRRNFIDECLEKNNHPYIDPLETIPYSHYRDNAHGYYNGDAETQRLVIKL